MPVAVNKKQLAFLFCLPVNLFSALARHRGGRKKNFT